MFLTLLFEPVFDLVKPMLIMTADMLRYSGGVAGRLFLLVLQPCFVLGVILSDRRERRIFVLACDPRFSV